MTQAAAEPRYRIEIRGSLDPEWSEWFEGMSVQCEQDPAGPLTTITGPVRDQAALHGILAKIAALNLPLLALTCLSGYGRC